MINDKDFLKLFYDSEDMPTKKELEEIIDEEMEKSEEEMDTDLIEYCLDVLNAMDAKEKLVSEERGESNGNVIKIRLKRIFKVAVTLIIILAFGKVFIVGEKETVVTVDIKSISMEKGFDNIQLQTFFQKKKQRYLYKQ